MIREKQKGRCIAHGTRLHCESPALSPGSSINYGKSDTQKLFVIGPSDPQRCSPHCLRAQERGGMRTPGTELRDSAKPCTVIQSIPAHAQGISGSPRLHSTRGYRGTWPSREGQEVQHHSKGYIMARSILKRLVTGSNSLLHPKYHISQANSRIRERH